MGKGFIAKDSGITLERLNGAGTQGESGINVGQARAEVAGAVAAVVPVAA